jgi:hypothetical protein
MIDTTNRFAVAVVASGGIVLLHPPQARELLTRDEALTLAAYLVALAESQGKGEPFAAFLEAVQNT